jgi:hypothetical protein
VGWPVKGKPRGGREHAQARPIRRILRRQNENGLGEIEFARDRLHRAALPCCQISGLCVAALRELRNWW